MMQGRRHGRPPHGKARAMADLGGWAKKGGEMWDSVECTGSPHQAPLKT